MRRPGWALLLRPAPPSQWTLVGPTSANDPDVLTFSGAPYTTSGRITAFALAPNCGQGHCNLYLAAAGGGVWRTDKALHTNPSQRWEFISGSFATNAIGTLTIDPSDPSGNTIYAGTGEPNASADSEAGFGIYKSTNGGDTWTHLASNTSVPEGSGVDCDAVFGVPPGTFGCSTRSRLQRSRFRRARHLFHRHRSPQSEYYLR